MAISIGMEGLRARSGLRGRWVIAGFMAVSAMLAGIATDTCRASTPATNAGSPAAYPISPSVDRITQAASPRIASGPSAPRFPEQTAPRLTAVPQPLAGHMALVLMAIMAATAMFRQFRRRHDARMV